MGEGQNQEKCTMKEISLKKKSRDDLFRRTHSTEGYWNSAAAFYWPVRLCESESAAAAECNKQLIEFLTVSYKVTWI